MSRMSFKMASRSESINDAYNRGEHRPLPLSEEPLGKFPYRILNRHIFISCSLTVIAGDASFNGFQIMLFTQNSALMEGEFLTRAKLSLASVAGETGQMVNAVPGPPYPVSRSDTPTAFGAPGPKIPERKHIVLSLVTAH